MVNLNIVKETVKAMMETSKKLGGLLVKFFSLGTVNLDGKETEAIEKLVGNTITGRDNWEKMGLGKERTGKIQEQHTERLFKSTYADAVDKTIEASILYSNTITFPYNLFDYWLRNEKDPFFCRIYWSNNLPNNLIHNNNENPITYPLNITFERLGNILRKGYWQGKLQLDYDPNGNMTACFARGVTFYEDKVKEFPNPKLGIKEIPDKVKYSATGGDNYTAQTITEPGEGITINIPYNPDQRGYGHSTYIRLTNSSVMDDFKNAVISSSGCNAGGLHYTSNQGFCWGCTYDELKKHNFVATKFTPSANCQVLLKLDVNSNEIKDLDLKEGVEYTVTITETQFIFKEPDRTKIIIQKIPGHDDFDNLNWIPPIGSGGEIEIPLTDPDLVAPDPGADVIPPETDFPIPNIDPTGREPEIVPLEPDITPDIDIPDVDPVPDILPPEIDPTPDAPGTDPTPDTGDRDPGDPDPGDGERPEDFD